MQFKKSAAFALTLIISLLLWFIFGDVLLNPGSYLFGSVEDGIKNYYTAAFYGKYDSGLWFSGMNYPYGEHIIYTDNQPFFAVLLNLIHRHITPVADHIIAIYNIQMLLSFVLCGLFLYLILIRQLLPSWYALLTAIIIAFLSPQAFRLINHYALSYTCIIPLCWYLLIRIFEAEHKFKWLLIYGFTTLVISFIHPYYALLNLFFLIAYVLIYYLQNKKQGFRKAGFYLYIFLAATLPLLFFQVFLHLTDPITDRPDTPFGFTEYRTSFRTLFLPVEPPLVKYWDALFRLKKPIWEGFAYVGQAGFLVLILTLFKFAKYIRRKRRRLIFRTVLPEHLRAAIWAAVLVLLFALAIPIKWGLEFTLEMVPPLKQFRSIGRFAWIFYYVFSVYTAFYLYQLFRYFQLKNKKNLSFALLIPALSFWGLEGFNNVYQKASAIKQNKIAKSFTEDARNYTDLLAAAGYKPSDFQAILALPYFSVGSEKITIFRSPVSPFQAMKASLNTGLPIIPAILSRTSLMHTMNHQQLFSNEVIAKNITNDFPSGKPLLLVYTKGDSLLEAEMLLVAKSRKIAGNNEVNLYELPLSKLQPAYSQELAQFTQNKSSLIKAGNYFSDAPVSFLKVKNFENYKAQNTFSGRGAAYSDKEPIVLYKGQPSDLPDSMLFESSVWVYAHTDLFFPVLRLKQTDSSGNVVDEKEMKGDLAFNYFKGWVRLAITFRKLPDCSHLEIWLDNRKITADQFLLKPLNATVYYTEPITKQLFKNNYPISD